MSVVPDKNFLLNKIKALIHKYSVTSSQTSKEIKISDNKYWQSCKVNIILQQPWGKVQYGMLILENIPGSTEIVQAPGTLCIFLQVCQNNGPPKHVHAPILRIIPGNMIS